MIEIKEIRPCTSHVEMRTSFMTLIVKPENIKNIQAVRTAFHIPFHYPFVSRSTTREEGVVTVELEFWEEGADSPVELTLTAHGKTLKQFAHSCCKLGRGE